MATKKYGLILPDKDRDRKPPVFKASHNVFGNDSDSEEETKKRPLLRLSDNTARQAKITQEKAVMEDPTVYQYDEIYDDMSIKKEKEKVKTKEEKKPQYIENLMKAANKRKIENERRVERQIQKEREKEGDEFQDKEVFVTSAYKKKLEEMRLEEEKEKREEYLESIGDVTKQQDLGGFYRHIYEQKLGKDTNVEGHKEEKKIKEDTLKQTDQTKTEVPQKRNYRKRKTSDTKPRLSEGEIEESDEEINRLNLNDIKAKKAKQSEENIDADSDFSIDESSDDETSKKDADKKSAIDEKPEANKSDVPEPKSSKKSVIVPHKTDDTPTEKVEPIKEKPKINIWAKRTVGVVFDEALKRYYERKAARGS